jgi:hypothetical protein
MWGFIFMWPSIVTNFFIIKPTRCTDFTNLFWHETLHVSDSSCVKHQVFIHCTQQWYMSHRSVDSFWAGPGWNCSSILVLLRSCLQTCVKYTIAECAVNKLLMMDRQTVWNIYRVSCQNKFVKLVHLVGFIIKRQVWGVRLPVRYRYNNLSVMMQGEVGHWGGEVLCDWQEMRAYILHLKLFLCLIWRHVKETEVYLHSD